MLDLARVYGELKGDGLAVLRVPYHQNQFCPKLGVPFWGSHNKNHSILGSILGSPYFGDLAR